MAPPALADARRFFLLVLALSMPFYLIGLAGWRMPGLQMLPVSALMGFVPMIAALALRARAGGWQAAAQLIASLADPFNITGLLWLFISAIMMPLVCLIEYVVLQWHGVPVPAASLAVGETSFLFLAFFIGAVGEELGWQGYAYGALRRDHSMLAASLILGGVWAVWHIVPFLELGRSGPWILWHSLDAVALRILIVWVYENAGRRIMVAVVFHTMINLCWAVFPVAGSFYDPLITFLILAPLVALVALSWQLQPEG